MTGIELYQILSSYSDDEMCVWCHHYSPRTKKYIDTCKNNIHLLKTSESKDAEEMPLSRIITELPAIGDTSDISIMYFGNEYIAELHYKPDYSRIADVIDISDFDSKVFRKHFFSNIPKIEDIEEAELIYKVEEYFFLNFADDTEFIVCKDCNRKIHWLDVEGDLNDKFNKLLDKQCGSC